MNYSELVKEVATKTGYPQKEAKAVITGAVEVITEALIADDKVSISGLGNFEARERAEREGRNPATGESIIIPRTATPHFKASSVFKKAVKEAYQSR